MRLVLPLLLLGSLIQAGEEPETNLLVEGALGCVVLPNPSVALTSLESLLAAIRPTPSTRSVSDQIGTVFGQTGLSGLDLTRPAMLVALRPGFSLTPPGALLLVTAKQASHYKNWAADHGWAATEEGSVLVLSRGQFPDQVQSQALAAYGRLPAGLAQDRIRVLLNLQQIRDTYDVQLRNLLAATLAILKTQAATDPRIQASELPLVLGSLVLLNGLHDALTLQTDLRLGPDRLSWEQVLVARPGTALAGLLTAPATTVPEAAPILGADPVLCRISARWDGPAVIKALRELLNRLAMDQLALGRFSPEQAERCQQSEVLHLLAHGSAGLVLRHVENRPAVLRCLAVADPAAAQRQLTSALTLLGSGGILDSFYQNLGLQVRPTFQDRVRAVAGQAIGAITVALTPQPDRAEALAPLLAGQAPISCEVALTPRWLIASTVPTLLDAALTPSDAPESAARRRWGPQHQIYCEADPIGLLRLALGLPGPKAKSLTGLLTNLVLPANGQPLTLVVDCDRGQAVGQGELPMALITEVLKKWWALQPER